MPQQDVPLEASETLAFTPPCLRDQDDPPAFILRTATRRDKRAIEGLTIEFGLRLHSLEARRAAILAGLKENWTEEQFEQHSEIIKAYWEASDDFALQVKEAPELVWSYDPDVEAGVRELEDELARIHRPLAKMVRDNVMFSRMYDLLVVAVIVKSWERLDVKRQMDGGYLSVDDCVEPLKAKLESLPGEAWPELVTECFLRMYLGEEFAKNFESPSPSSENLGPSNPTNISDEGGKSPAPARSKPTPATA